MKALHLLASLAFLLAMLAANSQETIDLNGTGVHWVSGMNHWSGKDYEESVAVPHRTDNWKATTDSMVTEVVINLSAKTVMLKRASDGHVIYNVPYLVAYQGVGQAVALKPEQTLFLANHPIVDMITFDSKTETLAVIHKNQKIRLFGYMAPANDK